MRMRHPMSHRILVAVAAACTVASSNAQSADPSLPHLVHQDGRHALIVDVEPFLILGAQSNNSSAWPAVSRRTCSISSSRRQGSTARQAASSVSGR